MRHNPTRELMAIAATLAAMAVLPAASRAQPTVADDAYSTPINAALNISAPGLLANDCCVGAVVAVVNGVAFTGTISFEPGSDLGALPSGAGLTVSSDGSFAYHPPAGADPATFTQDSFTYQAQDDRGLSTEATVTIAITPPGSSSPTANDDSYSVPAGTLLDVPAPGILANDTDPELDPLSVGSVDGVTPASFPVTETLTHGTLNVYQDGRITYQQDGTFSTTDTPPDTFTYTATDGTSTSAAATVSITTTAPPSSDTVLTAIFGDVQGVERNGDVRSSTTEALTIVAPAAAPAVVGFPGGPASTAALTLLAASPATLDDARSILASCERLALVAQARSAKYDLRVEVDSTDPAAYSTNGDGAVTANVGKARVRCWLDRTTPAAGGNGRSF